MHRPWSMNELNLVSVAPDLYCNIHANAHVHVCARTNMHFADDIIHVLAFVGGG